MARTVSSNVKYSIIGSPYYMKISGEKMIGGEI